ncbi:unnamed protein product [Closterium sp. NIES-53]
MWLLSFCDRLLITHLSTFGSTAAGLAGIDGHSMAITVMLGLGVDWRNSSGPTCQPVSSEPCDPLGANVKWGGCKNFRRSGLKHGWMMMPGFAPELHRPALQPSALRPAALPSARPTVLHVAPCCSPRVAPYCPTRHTLLQPERRALLQPACHALLPCASRPAAARASHPTALRVTPCCSLSVAPCCSQHVAPSCPARGALLQPARRALLPRASRPAAARASRPAARAAQAEPRCPARAALPNPSRPAAARATAAAGGGAAGSAGGAAALLLLLLLLLLVLLLLVVEVLLGVLEVLLVLEVLEVRMGVLEVLDLLLTVTACHGHYHGCCSGQGWTAAVTASPGRPHPSAASESAVAPGAGESAAALGARESADALGASASTVTDSVSAEALHTFTLDLDASRCFFRDCTTVTPLAAPVPVSLADPTGGLVVARASTVLPCPAVPFGSLSGLHLPTFLTNLLSNTVLQDEWPGSGLYTLTTASAQVAESGQVAASSRVCASGQLAAFFSCWVLSLDSPLAPPPRSPLAATSPKHALPSPCLWPSQVPALPPALAYPAVPSLRRGAAVHHSSLLRVSSDHCSSAHSPHGQTSPTLRWTGKVDDASVFRFYYLRERRVFSSQDITVDESVCFYRLHPHASHPVDTLPLVEPLEISSDFSGPSEGGDPTADDTAATRRSPRLETPPGFLPRPSSPPPQPGAVDSGAETASAEPGGAETEGEDSGGAATGGAGSGGAVSPSGGGALGDPVGGPGAGQPPRPDLLVTLLPQAIHAAASPGGTAGAGGAGGTAEGAGGAAVAGGTRGAGATSPGGATGVGGAGAASLGCIAGAGGAGGAVGAGGTGVGGTGGARAAGPGGARTGGTGAARAGGAASARGATRAAGTGGARADGAGGAGAGGTRGTGAARARGAGGAGGAT